MKGHPNLSARTVLAAMVAVSFGVRLALSSAHVTPHLLPDEYTYSVLARGFAETGLPTIRGEVVAFPALLQPLLTAPFWLAGDVHTAKWGTQALHALFMSAAAVPVFALARRLGLAERFALACAVLAVAGPGLVYASYSLADPVAYPLALGALYAAVVALERPSVRWELAFLVLAALATFTRLQYAVLPFVFVAAALAVDRGRVGGAFRHVRLTVASIVVAAAAVLALSPTRVLGPYAGVLDEVADPAAMARWAGVDLMLLVYAAGVVLVPGALVGAGLALVRPRARVEAAFAAVVVFFAGAMVALAAYVAAFESDRFQERYLIALPPLVAPAFALSLARGRWAQFTVAAVAAGLIVVALRFPVTDYVVAPDDSPTLLAVLAAIEEVGLPTTGLLVAVAANVLLAVAAVVAFRPRGAGLALAAAAASTALLSFGAWSHDRDASARVRDSSLPADPRWIDSRRLGDVTLLQTPGSSRPRALQQLYWNRSIRRVAVLGDADPVDSFGTTHARIGDDGRLTTGGAGLRDALLVATSGSTLDVEGAARTAMAPGFELWRPTSIPRAGMLTVGRSFDGWLAQVGSVTVWPERPRGSVGTLTLVLSLPPSLPETALSFSAPNVRRAVRLMPGQRRAVTFPIRVERPWTLVFRADRTTFLPGLRPVSVRSERPTVIWDGSAREGST